MPSVMVKVTQEDIDRGVQHDPLYCPIGRAVTNRFREPWFQRLEYLVPMRGFEVRTPASVKRFIHRFDRGLPVKPFNFILNFGIKTSPE